MVISKDTLIIDLIKRYPEAIKVFDKYKMGCLSCLGVQTESIEKGSLMHGVDLNALLKDLKSLQK